MDDTAGGRESYSPSRPGNRVRDVRQLQAFAHPLRVRLYYELGLAGEATATRLGRTTGNATALISYHLRRLASAGFVEEVPEHKGDGRERWWKLSDRRLDWYDSEFQETEAERRFTTTVQRRIAAERFRQVERYLSEQGDWSSAWLDAAFLEDRVLDLSESELVSLREEMNQLVRRYAASASRVPDTPRRRVMLILHGFPLAREENP